MPASAANPPVQIEIRDRIMHITLDRPEKKNAITFAMYTTMSDAIEAAEADPSVRVIFFSGGADCFTAGNDLNDFLKVAQGSDGEPGYRFLKVLSRATKPLVAVVNGPAVGIGTTLLLHCDLVYAGPRAQFQLPFVKLGLCPEAASSFLLPRLIGYQRAAELLLLGQPFDAPRALELGLINGIVPEEQLMATAAARAHQLAAQPPAAVRLTKRLLKQQTDKAVAQTLETEIGHFQQRLHSADAKEAFKAFLENREPVFGDEK